MENLKKAIQNLERLDRKRCDPEDHLFNIYEATEGIDMDDEGWSNFYRYITEQHKEDWEYLPRDKIVTLGDLGEDEIHRIQKTLEYPPNQVVTNTANGMEINVEIKNLPSIDKDEPVASAFEEISEEPSLRKSKNGDERCEEIIYQSRCEEKGQG